MKHVKYLKTVRLLGTSAVELFDIFKSSKKKAAGFDAEALPVNGKKDKVSFVLFCSAATNGEHHNGIPRDETKPKLKVFAYYIEKHEGVRGHERSRRKY